MSNAHVTPEFSVDDEVNASARLEPVRANKLPSWYIAYLALAVLNLVAVSLSLGLNFYQGQLLQEAGSTYQVYAQLLDELSDAGAPVIAANAPTSKVFVSHDVDAETAHLEFAAREFEKRFAQLQRHMTERLSAREQALLAEQLPNVERDWQALYEQSEQALASFGKGKLAEAGAHASARTDHFNLLAGHLLAMSKVIRTAQLEILAAQQSRAERQQRVNEWLVFGAAFVTVAVFFHAQRVRRATQRERADRERLIEELAHARDQAQHAARIKSQFLANMSHEIRTPMNGVIGMLDALTATRLSLDQAKLLRTANVSADLLLSVIDDVLDFSKIEAGMLVIESRPVNLPEIINHVQSLYGVRAAEKLLTLRCELPSQPLPRVSTDTTRMTQLLSNLVSNAIKFTLAGEVIIKVEVLAEDDATIRLKFAVRDSGIGLAADVQARLFAPFMQADDSTSRRFGGTGLGLAICKQLTTLLDRETGEIGVASTPGSGSTFFFNLRLGKVIGGQEINDASDIHSGLASGPMQFKGHVLIAEDNETNQQVINAMLLKLGLRTALAGNGREAVEAVQCDRFDMILMDYHMPELDGCDASLAIRQYEHAQNLQRTPIVAVTASVLSDDKQRCLGSGMDDFLAKPIRQKNLSAMLEKWLPASACLGPIQPESLSIESSHQAWTDLPTDIFDLEQLLEMRGIAGDSFDELIAQFHNSATEGIASMSDAVECRDAAVLRRAAHKLKGAAATLGAKTVAERCHALEISGMEQRIDDATEQLRELKKQYQDVRRFMTACMQVKTAPAA